jgi:uncharacterized protein YjbI with pentapeptide repeats
MVDRPPQPADDDNAKVQPADGHNTKARKRRRLTWTLAGIALLVLGLLVVLLLACVLWIPRSLYPPLTEVDLQGVSDAAKVQELKGARLKLQNDARTTLLQGLGALLVLLGATGGVVATLRQIRVSQGQLKTTRKQIRQTLKTTQKQLNLTEQGQSTNRYTDTVEQLGHEKATVRLGALYSLEHLAQDNPKYRQTVVDVVCAYLRMPYIPPARNGSDATHVQAITPAEDGIPTAHLVPGQNPAQEELQVRKTAQRLLAYHLLCPPGTSGQDAQLLPPSPQQIFWPGISLDLTGAALVDFHFERVSVIQARFDEATFQGDAGFRGATFQDDARFSGATFQGDAGFINATFQGHAEFVGTTFKGDAPFIDATFKGDARLSAATFKGAAGFTGAAFQGKTTTFSGATFQGITFFDEATFQSPAVFHKATFQGGAAFDGVTFQGHAEFSGATFQGVATFSGATFESSALFGKATFQGTATFDQAHVLHLDDPEANKYRAWLDRWTVRPDPTDPSRGTLVHAEHAMEPEPATPRPTTPGNR